MKRNNYAGFGIRLGAYIIDILIIMGLFAAILFSGFLIAKVTGSTSIYIISLLSIMIIPPIYIIYFIGKTGQTYGKKWLGVKVVGDDGKPIGYGLSFIRYIGYIINAFLLYLGFLWIIWDKEKQGLHDKIVNSHVIKVRK